MNDPIVWTPDTVPVGELVPWAENPRRSTKAEARRIIESREKFGEAKPLLIGPNNELYDGHQNTSALLAVKGKKHPVKVWRSNRELTTTERQELVLALHQGATGGWDLEALANWEPETLVLNGFDKETLAELNRQQAFLIELFSPIDGDDEEGFTPNTSPEIGGVVVTEDSLDKAEQKLAGISTKNEQGMIAVVCPCCGEEFFIRRSDVV